MTGQPHEVEVTIYDGATLLVTRRCRLVHLPDGRAAAIWRGLAFPVLAGDRIDAAGDAWPAVETLPYAIGTRPFAVIEGQSEAYVLVPGGFIEAENSATAIRSSGIEVLRTGRYFGEAVKGVDADWFVRVVRPADCVDLAARLEPILGQPIARGNEESSTATRARLLTAELLAARDRETALRAELLEAQTAPMADAVSGAEARIEALREALAAEQQRREAAEQAVEAVESRPAVAPSGKIADEVRDVLAALLPDIQLLRDSIEVITLEFDTRRVVWRSLAELALAKGAPRDWKKIRGAEGWWERHMSDGRDNTGRIYARRGKGAAWEVLISHKSEQNRDIAWLARR